LNAALSTHFNADVRAALLADFTFEGWFILTLKSEPAFVHGIFSHGDAGSEVHANNYFAAMVDETGTLTVDFEHGAGSSADAVASSAPGAVPFGVPAHIAVRKTMTGASWTCDIFVDGENVTAGANTGLTNGDGSDNSEVCCFTLCRGQTSGNQFNGVIDDARLSGMARTDAEILESYHRGLGLITPVIANVSPPDLSTIAVGDTVTFDVTDADDGLERVTITVGYGPDYIGGAVTELVYDNGFAEAYLALSTATSITSGLAFVVDRDTWPSASLAFMVRAHDLDGNEATTRFSYTTT
jgi:hypothetical protein